MARQEETLGYSTGMLATSAFVRQPPPQPRLNQRLTTLNMEKLARVHVVYRHHLLWSLSKRPAMDSLKLFVHWECNRQI